MRLSKNFTLDELTRTDTGLPNNPGEKEIAFLLLLTVFILQPLRNKFGRIHINSGFRSPRVNREINGSSTSQHMDGQAGDIVPMDADLFDVYLRIIANSHFDYGQCIIYPDRGFIHISLPRPYKENRQALICFKGEYFPYSLKKFKEISKEGN